MPRPAPVTDAERDRVRELHGQGWARARIARDIGRSASTVGRIGEQLGLTWDRSRTEQATRAAQVDLAARRAELAALLLDDAFRLRVKMYEPVIVYDFVKGGGERAGEFVSHELLTPPYSDIRQIMTTVAIAIDKHVALVKVDQDTAGVSAVDAWLRGLLGDATDAGRV